MKETNDYGMYSGGYIFDQMDRAALQYVKHEAGLPDDAVLIGGPAFIKVAYNMSILDTIVVTTTKGNITGDPKYKNPLIKHLRHPTTQIDFGDIIVRIYKAQHGVQK